MRRMETRWNVKTLEYSALYSVWTMCSRARQLAEHLPAPAAQYHALGYISTDQGKTPI